MSATEVYHQLGIRPNMQEATALRRIFDGRETPWDWEAATSWDLKSLPRFQQLLDIEKAADRIIVALSKRENIGVYGDYDVDGTTSCALLFHFFQMLGHEVKTYQPSRFVEGYGLHNSSIDQALEDEVDLLMTVDCGISNYDAAEYAREKGLELIITDHHQDGAPQMPRAHAVINPNRRDEECEPYLKALAGVGVAFALAVTVREKLLSQGQQVPSLYPLLAFYAIGTLSDLAPLNPMNLTLCRHGLKELAENRYPGLAQFLEERDELLTVIDGEKVSFFIGPHINSQGRLDHPEMALELLKTNSDEAAERMFRELKNSNTERKKIQAEVYEEAKKQFVELEEKEPQHAVVVYGEHWHEGVIGIVASKLVESFKRPCLVFSSASEEGVIKASGRTFGKVDVFEALSQHRDQFIKFGGHPAAAGLSMELAKFENFRKEFQKTIGAIDGDLRKVERRCDGEIEFSELNIDLLESELALAPFGQGNIRPIYRLKSLQIISYKVLKEQHVKFEVTEKDARKGVVRRLNMISFFFFQKFQDFAPDQLMKMQQFENLVFDVKLSLNKFRGRYELQLMLHDLWIDQEKVH